MAGLHDVPVREPTAAGMFYPADARGCREAASRLIGAASADTTREWIGGIVPHAGWICSGAVAAQTLVSVARSAAPDLVVIFGAIHTPLPTDLAVLDSYAAWQLPGESSQVDRDVRAHVAELTGLFRVDDRFHEYEHAVEVELPLIRLALPSAAILPIEVPLDDRAVAIGTAAAKKINDAGMRAVYLASSDLTHYGPAYRFTPSGVGLPALEFARSNDRMLLDLIERFRPEQVVTAVREHANACGGGAIAAMLAACRECGAATAKVLRHTSSFETLAAVAPQPSDNAVGYASVVVG